MKALIILLTFLSTTSAFATINPITPEGQNIARMIEEARALAKNGRTDRAASILVDLLHNPNMGRYPVQVDGRIINARTATLRALGATTSQSAQEWLKKYKREGDIALESGEVKAALESYRLGHEIAPEYEKMLSAIQLSESLLSKQGERTVDCGNSDLQNIFSRQRIYPGDEANGTEWVSADYSVGQRKIKIASDKNGEIFWLVSDKNGQPVAPYRVRVGSATVFSGRQFIERSRIVSKDGQYFLVSPEGLIRLSSSGELEELYLQPREKLIALGLTDFASMLELFQSVRAGAVAWSGEEVRNYILFDGHMSAWVRRNNELRNDLYAKVEIAKNGLAALQALSYYERNYIAPFLEDLLMNSAMDEQAAKLLHVPDLSYYFTPEELMDRGSKKLRIYELTQGLASRDSLPYLISKLQDRRLAPKAIPELAKFPSPELIKILESQLNGPYSIETAQALAELGPAARSALPRMLELYASLTVENGLKNPLADAIIRTAPTAEAVSFILMELEKPGPLPIAVIQGVGRIGYPARDAVPRLSEHLRELLERRYVWQFEEVQAIINTLSILGKEAESAIPALLLAAHPHQDVDLKYRALEALGRMGRLVQPHSAPMRKWLEGLGRNSKYRHALERTLRLIGEED